MTTVLAAGVFDFLHPGHKFYLQSAHKLADRLVVIVARDENVQRIKGFLPVHSENERVQMVESMGIAEQVVLGRPGGDLLAIVAELKPDVIAVGYDQKLPSGFAEKFPHVQVVQMEAKNPEEWKSSKYRMKAGRSKS